jgi:hypothetical protein
MQLRCGVSIADLENCLVICVSLRVEAAGGPKYQKGGWGCRWVGAVENLRLPSGNARL